MAEQFIRGHIRNLPLLAQVPSDQLTWLADAFEIVQLRAGTLVFHQGQPAQGLFLLARGHAHLVNVTANGDQVLGEVRENQYVGEGALFESVNERVSMRVTTDSILLFLDRVKFQQVLLAHPEIRPHLAGNFPQTAPDAPSTFRSQRAEEQLLLRQHRHHWAFLRGSILPLIVGIALLVGALFFVSNPLIRVPMIAAAFILPALWIYYVYVEWRNDFIIITDLRVIRTEKTILSFEEEISEVPIGSVHEVNFVIPPADIFARFFNYGTVFIKTAGESGNMTLTLVPNPQQMQQMLIKDKLNYEQASATRNRDAIAQEIDRVLNPNAPEAQLEFGSSMPGGSDRQPASPGGGFLGTRYTDGQGNIVYRKHLSIWVTHIFLPFMGMVAGVVIAGLSLFVTTGNSLGAIGIIPGVAVFVISILWLYWADWDWRNDMMILGDATVRIIHRRPLWLQNENEQFLLTQVDSVSAARDGMLNTLMNRGDVRISLVGDDHPKMFNGVPNPYGVQDEVSEHRAAVLNRERAGEEQRYRDEIVQYLDVYHERLNESNAQNQPTQGYPPPAYPPPQPPQMPPSPSPSPAPDRDGPRPPRIPRSRS